MKHVLIAGCCLPAGLFASTVLGAEPPRNPSTASNAEPTLDLSKAVIVFAALMDEQWDLYAWNPDGRSPPRRLTHTPVDELRPSLAGDRKSVVYETTDGSLIRLDLLTGDERQLPFASDQKFDMQPSVGPDGKSVLAATSLSRKLDDTNLAIISIGDDQSVRQLDFPSSEFLPCFAPDGERFAFVHLHARGWVGEVTTEIWMGRLDPPMARQLTMMDSLTIDPSWALDGKRVLFASRPEGQFDIFAVDVESRKVDRLTHHPSADTDPVSSPDGKSVLFVSMRSGVLGLWLLGEGKTEPSELRPFDGKRVRCKDPDWR